LTADDDPSEAIQDALSDVVADLLSELGGGATDGDAAVVLPSKSASIGNSELGSIDISAGSLDSGDGVVVSVVPVAEVDLPAAPAAATEGVTSGTFQFGSSAINITFRDDDGNPLPPGKKLNKPAKVCVPFTSDDLNNASGGPDGVKIWHYTNGAWSELSTNLTFNPNLACAWVSSFSPFALGLAVALPDEDAEVPAGLPATGDYSPSMTVLIAVLMGGVALVGTGAVAVRRSRRAEELS